MSRWVIVGKRDGRVVQIERRSVDAAFTCAARMRELGYAVKVSRRGWLS